MPNKIGIVGLAPGEVAYYDELTRIHLTLSRPRADVFDHMNTTRLRRSVAAKTLLLLAGTLNPITQLKELDMLTAKNIANKPKVTQAKVTEKVEEKKAEKVIEEVKEIIEEKVVEEVKVQEAVEAIEVIEEVAKVEETVEVEAVVETIVEETVETETVTEEVAEEATEAVEEKKEVAEKKPAPRKNTRKKKKED